MIDNDTFNASGWLVDRHVDAGDGDRVAFETPTRTITYAELADLNGKVAAGLRSLGFRRDDRLSLVANDDIPLVAGILGAIRGGFVASPMSTMLNGSELAKIIGDSGAYAVLASDTYADAILFAVSQSPNVKHVIWDGQVQSDAETPGVTHHSFDDIVAAGAAAQASEREVVPAGGDAWCLWLYTSGTTGMPKAAMHRHMNFFHVAETYGKQVLRINRDDACLSVAKVFFAFGIGNSVIFPLSVGARTILEPARPTPKGMAQRIQESKPTLFFAVPTFFAGMMGSDVPDDLFAGVRYAASAGEALPETLQQNVKKRFGLDILDGIGSTELLHIFISNNPDDIKMGSTGKPVPGYDIQLRDLDGNLVPDGEPGNLFVRGESMALGYWRRTDSTRSVFQGEWLNGGDIYVRDEDGYYTCMGRNNDLIKAGGIWMSPIEVENCLLEHPAIVECAVIGVLDENGLDKPVAFVVSNDDAVTEKDLQNWCREKLAHFKVPRKVLFADELPKTATGKLQRFKLRGFMEENDPAGGSRITT